MPGPMLSELVSVGGDKPESSKEIADRLRAGYRLGSDDLIAHLAFEVRLLKAGSCVSTRTFIAWRRRSCIRLGRITAVIIPSMPFLAEI